MTVAISPKSSIAAGPLADRLAHGERITVLDVREDPEWGIEAPGVISRQMSSSAVSADLAGLARELDGPVVVVCNRGITAQPVAQALRGVGVDAMAVEDGMRGWIMALQARPVELGVQGVLVRQIQRPGRGCLSYLLAAGGNALVVDPAPDAGFYVALAAELGARITNIVDTHLHADHISGARMLSEQTGATLRLPALALERGVAYAEHVEPLHDSDTIQLGAVSVNAISLPGQTTDMTGLLIADRALVAGDSLFLDGIARPDLQQSDPEGAHRMARLLHGTLRERVLALGEEVLLLPGHAHPGVNPDAVVAPLGDVRAAVPKLAIDDADQFAAELLSATPPRPANYEAIIAVNAGTRPCDTDLETGGNSCSAR
ncbi:MAG: MBL fold metallo-hydrolase [Solirubrobacteraceae bacterium]|jgi:glyoxylase-like metal-dependent hydrolase (beta-lactamase superfamily II)